MTAKMRDVLGFPDYQVDETRNVCGSKKHLIKPQISNNYLQVGLHYCLYPKGNLIELAKKIHIIVCESFWGKKPTFQSQARQLNGNSFNNCKNNLCWVTAKEDARDCKRYGKGRHSIQTSNYYGQIEQIKALRCNQKRTLQQIACLYPSSTSRISRIARGSVWGEE